MLIDLSSHKGFIVILSDLLGIEPKSVINDVVTISNGDSNQIFIDCIIDGIDPSSKTGDYKYPEGKHNWKDIKTGKEAVHKSLMFFKNCIESDVYFSEVVRNSRGRGISLFNCSYIRVFSPYTLHCRTVGINIDTCSVVGIFDPISYDTSNYQEVKQDPTVQNYTGSIKAVNSNNVNINFPLSYKHLGNGITATECRNVKIKAGISYQVYGPGLYLNASPNVSVIDCIVIPPTANDASVAVNSEKENTGECDNLTLTNLFIFGGKGLGFWGNEGKEEIVLDNVALNSIYELVDQPGRQSNRTTFKDLVMKDRYTSLISGADENLLLKINLTSDKISSLMANMEKAIQTGDHTKIKKEKDLVDIEITQIKDSIKKLVLPSPVEKMYIITETQLQEIEKMLDSYLDLEEKISDSIAALQVGNSEIIEKLDSIHGIISKVKEQ